MPGLPAGGGGQPVTDLYDGWWAAPMLDGSTACGQSGYAVFSVYAHERGLPWRDVEQQMQAAIERGDLVPWEATDVEPDWSASSTMMGGYLADIPYPHVRMYPDPTGRQRRRVRLRITQIMRHYHVSYFEAANPIWNGQTRTWQTAWDDEAGSGRQGVDFFDLYADARRYIDDVIREHFPPETHEIDGVADIDGEDRPTPAAAEARRAFRSAREGD